MDEWWWGLGSDFLLQRKLSGIQKPKPKRLKWQEMSRLGKTEEKGASVISLVLAG